MISCAAVADRLPWGFDYSHLAETPTFHFLTRGLYKYRTVFCLLRSECLRHEHITHSTQYNIHAHNTVRTNLGQRCFANSFSTFYCFIMRHDKKPTAIMHQLITLDIGSAFSTWWLWNVSPIQEKLFLVVAQILFSKHSSH